MRTELSREIKTAIVHKIIAILPNDIYPIWVNTSDTNKCFKILSFLNHLLSKCVNVLPLAKANFKPVIFSFAKFG